MYTPNADAISHLDSSPKFINDLFYAFNASSKQSFLVHKTASRAAETVDTILAKFIQCVGHLSESEPLIKCHTSVWNLGSRGDCRGVAIFSNIAISILLDPEQEACFYTISSRNSSEEASKLSNDLFASLSFRPISKDATIDFSFWFASHSGVQKRIKRLSVPSWFDIGYNYHPDTRLGIEQLLCSAETGQINGGIVVLRGSPGTGKTHLIRSLCRAMATKFSANYIVDLPTFLSNGDYMFDVMMFDQDGIVGKFIIAEDADMILGQNARENSGPGFGTLLNASNGILGQGTNSIFILSTNKEIDEIDDAILRNGRCVSDIDFKPLPLEQSRHWAEINGIDPDTINTEHVLADLYAKKNSSSTIRVEKEQERRVGF